MQVFNVIDLESEFVVHMVSHGVEQKVYPRTSGNLYRRDEVSVIGD